LKNINVKKKERKKNARSQVSSILHTPDVNLKVFYSGTDFFGKSEYIPCSHSELSGVAIVGKSLHHLLHQPGNLQNKNAVLKKNSFYICFSQ
jgi:hypothetical protein